MEIFYRMLVFVLVLLGMGRVSVSSQLHIQPNGADAAIRTAKGKIGAENLCKDKPPCEDKRQCTDFFFVLQNISLSLSLLPSHTYTHFTKKKHLRLSPGKMYQIDGRVLGIDVHGEGRSIVRRRESSYYERRV